MKAKDRRFHIRVELNEEGGYTATVPELPGCISEGETLQEALTMIQDAMAAWLQVAQKYGDPIPQQFQAAMNELPALDEVKANT